MSKIVIRKTNEMVKIKIDISYIGPLSYQYKKSLSDDLNYKSTDMPPKAFPHDYLIGKGNEVIDNIANDNTWYIKIINPSDKKLEYELKLEWYQGDDKVPLYTWPEDKSEQKGMISASTDHITLTGNCYYDNQ
jgi:hypothetical protein